MPSPGKNDQGSTLKRYVAQPYIGITGISTPWEIDTITGKWFHIFRWGADDRRFMNGVLVSSKSLADQEPSNPQLYPKVARAVNLMPADERVMNTVHFNISDLTARPSQVTELGEHLAKIVRRLPQIEAIQINLAWPSPDLLRAFRESHSQLLILQISAKAYAAHGNQPSKLVETLRHYAEAVDYVLIDPSGGTGQAFDHRQTAVTLEALMSSDLPMLWGVAGGLGPRSLGSLRKLLEDYPHISWDAQGRLRDDNGHLGWAECFDFLRGSLSLSRLADQATAKRPDLS